MTCHVESPSRPESAPATATVMAKLNDRRKRKPTSLRQTAYNCRGKVCVCGGGLNGGKSMRICTAKTRGAEFGTEIGTEIGAEIGTEFGTEFGTEIGTEFGTEIWRMATTLRD